MLTLEPNKITVQLEEFCNELLLNPVGSLIKIQKMYWGFLLEFLHVVLQEFRDSSRNFFCGFSRNLFQDFFRFFPAGISEAIAKRTFGTMLEEIPGKISGATSEEIL